MNELGVRILKNVIYWAVWEVFLIVLNATFLIKQLCLTFSLPPDFTLNCGGVSHEHACIYSMERESSVWFQCIFQSRTTSQNTLYP